MCIFLLSSCVRIKRWHIYPTYAKIQVRTFNDGAARQWRWWVPQPSPWRERMFQAEMFNMSKHVTDDPYPSLQNSFAQYSLSSCRASWHAYPWSSWSIPWCDAHRERSRWLREQDHGRTGCACFGPIATMKLVNHDICSSLYGSSAWR